MMVSVSSMILALMVTTSTLDNVSSSPSKMDAWLTIFTLGTVSLVEITTVILMLLEFVSREQLFVEQDKFLYWVDVKMFLLTVQHLTK